MDRAGVSEVGGARIVEKLEEWILGDGHYSRRCGLFWQGKITEIVKQEGAIAEEDKIDVCTRIGESLRMGLVRVACKMFWQGKGKSN